MAHLNLVDGSRITYKSDDSFAEPFLSIPQMHLSQFLQLGFSKENYDRELQWGVGTDDTISSTNGWTQSSLSHESGASSDTLSKSEVEGFVTALERCPRVPGITDGERIQLLALLDILAEMSSPYEASQYENLDDPARR
jgi:hypothetical protein